MSNNVYSTEAIRFVNFTFTEYFLLFHLSEYLSYNSCTLTDLQLYVRELVEVGSVIDGAYFDCDSRGTFADVRPVHTAEERYRFHIFDATLRTQSDKKKKITIRTGDRNVCVLSGQLVCGEERS